MTFLVDRESLRRAADHMGADSLKRQLKHYEDLLVQRRADSKKYAGRRFAPLRKSIRYDISVTRDDIKRTKWMLADLEKRRKAQGKG